MDDYTEWREKHRKTHTIISELEEKKRLLYEQVRIKKLQAEIEHLERTLERYAGPTPKAESNTPVKQKIRAALKALLRPTPQQRIRQKQQLENGIKKVQNSIDKFDNAMDDLSESLRKQSGRGFADDPVELVFGKRKGKNLF